MAISRTTQSYLTKGDFESLEDDWLGAVAEHPEDLDFFVGVARALVGTDEAERARFLLGMLDAELVEQGRWRTRLKLLKRAASLLLEPEKIHQVILETLDGLHADSPNFEVLAEAVGLHRATHDIPKTWEKVERLEELIVFDVGTVVAMDKRGVGRVVELNRELESFKVDFQHFSALNVGFRAASKLLTPLDPDHVLRRRLEDPEGLRELVKNDPPALLRVVLKSYDRPLAAGEVREALAGIVPDSSWTSFWAAARKHPQVVTGGKGRQSYTWAQSDEHALEAVWKGFARAVPRKKIDVMKREGERDPELARRMADELAAVAETAFDAEPGLSFEIWMALTRAGCAPADAPWSASELVLALPPARLFDRVEDRSLREEGYRLVRELRDDWREVYLELLARETEPKALDVLAEGLEAEAGRDLGRFVDGVLAQPQKAPAAFYWIADRAARDETLRGRNPLRLLQQILQMPLWDEFAPWRARFPALVESGGTVPRLLGQLTAEQAPQAEELIKKAGSLEPYQRQELTNALHLKFPALTAEREEDRLYAVPASIEAKRQEFQTLVTKELPANRKAIEEARAMGDLRENFEYKSARQRHEYLSARASQLERELAHVQPIGRAPADVADVRIGTTVTLDTGAGRRRVTVLGPWESDPEGGVLSYRSDLARALLGKKQGESVEVSGERYTVAEIAPADF